MMCKLHLLINTKSDGFTTTQQPQLLLLLLLNRQISIARRPAGAAASTASNRYDVGTRRGNFQSAVPQYGELQPTSG